MSHSTLSIRIEDEVKKNFDNFCNDVGLNPSVAVNMFVRAVLREKRIPFEIAAAPESFYSSSESLEALREAKELLNNPATPRFKTVAAMRNAILDSNDDV